MQDISLHILDIIENSVRAGAKNIWITIHADLTKNKMIFKIKDDGTGMDEETLEQAQNPFYTSKLERKKKVGLGIPLFKQNAEHCNGYFKMNSKIGEGTELDAVFAYDSIDRMPLGNIGDTILSSIIGHPEVDIHLYLKRTGFSNNHDFKFNTVDVKKELGDIPITYPDVINFIEESLKEGIKNTKMEEV